MVLPGETVHGFSNEDDSYTCPDCGVKIPLEVLSSGGGYYIGYMHPRNKEVDIDENFDCWFGGPYSRESGYYGTREEAQKALDSGLFFRM